MRILQINSVCGIGSTGRIATDIHKMLIEQGHESYIAFGRGEPKNCENNIRIGKKYDVYSHVVKTRIFDKHGFGSKNATLEFIEKVKILDPDIIHLHNIHGYYINIEILFSYLKSANKPVVWTLHDCWAFTGHCSHFEYVGCYKWNEGCHQCPQKKEYPTSWVFDNSKSNYLDKKKCFTGVDDLTIVTPSEWLANQVKNSFLNCHTIKTIHNGIDLSVFKPTKSNFRLEYGLVDKFIILGVANIWNNRKGLNHYFELSKYLENGDVIVLIGLNKKQIAELPENIIGIERTSKQNELAGIYTSSDVFVNLTLEDTYPTVNLEAIACGVPVITYDSGGSSEMIKSSFGHVTKTKTVSEVKQVINLFKTQYSHRKRNEKESLDISITAFIQSIKMLYLSILLNIKKR